MINAVPHLDALKRDECSFLSLFKRDSVELQRERDVFDCAQSGDEVKGLEDKPYFASTQQCALVVVELPDVQPV